MTASVNELVAPKTAEQFMTELLAVLAAADPPFPVTAWSEGNVLRTLAYAEAVCLSDLQDVIRQLTSSNFLQTAERDWLTLRALSTFALTRIAATRATHTVRVACLAGAGPVTISSGSMLVTRANGSAIWRSTNATNETVPDGGYFDFTVMCETAGRIGNASIGTITTLITPAAAGLSATHTATGIVARDEETDAELRTRCRSRWATLAAGGPAGAGTRDAYTYLLLSATMDGTPVDQGGVSCGITRCGYSVPPATGVVGIAIAGGAGLLDDSQRNAARTYVSTRCALTDAPDIQHASTVDVDLTGTTVEFYPGQNNVTNQSKVATAIEDFINSFPMGSDSDAPVIDEAAIAAAIYGAFPQRGVIKNVNLFTGDVSIPALTIGVVNTTLIAWS